MFQTQLEFIRQQLPASLLPYAFIAGGAAIAPQTAGDIDVFILGGNTEELENHLFTLHSVADMANFTTSDRSPREQAKYLEGLGTLAGIEFIANLFDPATGEKVQFISVRTYSVFELLESFDISTHAWAIGLESGRRYSLPTASTTPAQLPRVLHISNPVITLRRLKKLCARYGWEWDPHPDLEKLREHATKSGLIYQLDMELHRSRMGVVNLFEEVPF